MFSSRQLAFLADSFSVVDLPVHHQQKVPLISFPPPQLVIDFDCAVVYDDEFGQENLSRSVNTVQQSSSKTLTAWLHISNRCNLSCPYCYLHKTADDLSLAHGMQAIDAVVRSAIQNGFKAIHLKYAGGEATLSMATLVRLHEYANEQAVKHGLILSGVVLSNGVFPATVIDKLKQSDLRVMISLDGVGEVHDAQRQTKGGHGSFLIVKQTLDRLRKANVIHSVSITLTHRNAHGLADTVRFCLEREIPFSLNFFRDNECASTFSDLQFEEQEIIDAMKAAYAVVEENLPPYSLLGSILDRANLSAPHKRPCGVGENYLVIDQNGGVAKCQMEITDTVTDIWSDDPLADVRLDQIAVQNPSVDEKEGCRDCEWKNWCAGGCPALTYRATGRFDVKSPNCNIYKALFPEALRLEGLRILKYANQEQETPFNEPVHA